MSGIAGIYHRDGKPADPRNLDRMLDAIGHRGPDARFTFVEGNVALGLNLMITTPEARHERLYRTPDSPYVIAADARIDNRDELIEACGAPHLPVREIPDSELIVAAYDKWGEDCPKHLLGDFAFAIWDRRQRRLFCARDHVGIKPVLFHLSDSLFAVATEVKAILQLPAVPRTINEPRIADFLEGYPEVIDKTSTFYKSIHKLAGAHRFRVSSSKAIPTCYWSPSDAPDLPSSSDSGYEERFRQLFSNALECRLRSARPPGAMLSGGLDSSSIVCAAQKILEKRGEGPLRTYSGVADPDFPCPERPYVDAVRSAYHVDATIITADQMPEFVESIRCYLKASDDPFDSILITIPLAVYDTAAGTGCNVILDGIGGDEVAGVPQALRCRMLESESRFRALADSMLTWRSYGGFRPSSLRMTLQYDLLGALSQLYVPNSWKPLLRRLRRRFQSPPPPSLINPDFAERVNLPQRVDATSTISRGDFSSVRALHAAMIGSPILSVANDRYDRAAAFFGIEARRPFLDQRLVEFFVGLPLDQKLRRGWTKWICRSALAGVVPDKVRWRQTPSGVFSRFHELLCSDVSEAFKSEIRVGLPLIEPYLNGSVLEAAMRSGTTPSHWRQVIQTTALLSWLRRQPILGQ